MKSYANTNERYSQGTQHWSHASAGMALIGGNTGNHPAETGRTGAAKTRQSGVRDTEHCQS
jgi:hypothetical protein